MTKGNREFLIWLGAALLLLILLLRRPKAQPTPGVGNPWGSGNPWTWTVPGFPDSPAITGGNITVDVHGQRFAGIGDYFPIFGFVGIDTTMIYQ